MHHDPAEPTDPAAPAERADPTGPTDPETPAGPDAHGNPVPVQGVGLLGIGALSRASGLSVSALRFYDREGVLVPADVDGATGYRRYHPDQVRPARLLAGMRRIQIPVPEMVAVLESLGDDEAVTELFDLHLARLEQGLSDARREVTRLRDLARGPDARPRAVRLDGAALHTALAAVRYAAGQDPEFPVLSAVLLDRDADGVRAVATDRYRLAVALAPEADGGDPVRILLPLPMVDELLSGSPPPGRLEVSARGGRVTMIGQEPPDGARPLLAGAEPEGDYPDVRRVLDHAAPPGVELSVADVRAALSDQPGPPPDRVHVSPGGTSAGPDSLLVDRGFLWDALDRVRDGHVVLPLGGVIAPLLVRSADASRVGLVMPVREET